MVKAETIGLEKGEKLGLAKGERLGLAKGERLGLEKGIQKEKRKHLIAMIQEGIADEVIMKISQISKQELQKEKQALGYSR